MNIDIIASIQVSETVRKEEGLIFYSFMSRDEYIITHVCIMRKLHMSTVVCLAYKITKDMFLHESGFLRKEQ